jgi:5-oxoprolinase (ATP-hydrolysing) subunit B
MPQHIPPLDRPRVLRAGDRGWLVELASNAVSGLTTAIREQEWASLVAEVVPAARTVLVITHDAAHADLIGAKLVRLLADFRERLGGFRATRTIEIPVRYDGPDLDAVSEAVGMSPDEVARAHSGAEHVVSFFGFSPGFAYIDGSPDELALPRRDTPRTRVEAGQVAIAGSQTVVYPGGTPGGWHLIGHTEVRLWDPRRQPPNRLDVGDRVIFRPVTPC